MGGQALERVRRVKMKRYVFNYVVSVEVEINPEEYGFKEDYELRNIAAREGFEELSEVVGRSGSVDFIDENTLYEECIEEHDDIMTEDDYYNEDDMECKRLSA